MRARAISAAAVLACVAGTAMGQQVKISQVYPAGGLTGAAYNRDFVELFNAGAAPVDLSGWSIQYAAATGSAWSKTDLPPVFLQPGAYFLVQMTLTGSAGAELPSPDHFVTTSISMATAAGKVALVSSTDELFGTCPTDNPAIVDFVGYGTTANCFEGGGPTAATSASLAVLRNGDGCVDNGDNSGDFTAGTPMPRNTFSPPNNCPQQPGADLGVRAQSGRQTDIGGTFSAAYVVTNYGPDLATGVQLAIPIPANTTLQSSNPLGTLAGGVLTVPLPDLPLGATAFVSIDVRADAGPSFELAATASSAAPDAIGSNNTATAQGLVYVRANAKLVMGVDLDALDVVAVDVESGATEPLFRGNVRALASDDANRRFYYSTGSQLWAVPYDPPRIPVQVGTFNGAVSSLSAGLAYDSIRNRLLATDTSGGIFAVDPVTATTTLLVDLGVGDLQGIDFDPVRDRIIATNDSTSTVAPMSGRGLYLIEPNGSEVTFIAGYPVKAGSTLETDLDACAYGEGVIYPVADERLWCYRYDEASASYLPPFETPFGEDQVFSGATFTSELFNPSPGANLTVAVSGPADCEIGVGETLTYTVTLRNFGPDPSADAVLTATIPAGTVFLGSTPPLTPVGDQLQWPVGTLGAGAEATLQVQVQPTAAGVAAVSASASASSVDPFPVNNAASYATEIRGEAPSSAVVQGIFSTLPGSNEVPGLPGLLFSDVVDLGRPARSYSGEYWVITADTDDPATTQDRVLLRGTGTTFHVAAREGVTLLPTFEFIGNFDAVVGVNDSGDFVFGTDLGGDAGEVLIRSNDDVLEILAREGDPVPAVPGASFGTTRQGASIQNDGSVSFYTNMTGLTTTTDTAWLDDGGATLLAQESVTVPGNQGGGQTNTWRVLDTGATTGLGLFVSADGQRWSGRGSVGPTGPNDLVMVVNGDVVIQEGFPLPGSSFAENVSLINMNFVEPHGDWFAYGSNFNGTSTNGQDWVVRNGQVLAARDEEAIPGSGIFWAEANYPQTFFLATGNRFGDYVIGGLTTEPDDSANAMVVFNRSRIVLRENEPVDLNADGVFDEDAYIHIFRDDFAWLGEDGYLYAVVRLRDGSGICTGTPAEVGEAMIRVRVFCPADWNRDDSVNSADISAFLSSWLGALNAGTVRADFNGDTAVNSADISAFLSAWLAALSGGC